MMQPRVFCFAEYAATRYLHENAGKSGNSVHTSVAVAAWIRYRDEFFFKTSWSGADATGELRFWQPSDIAAIWKNLD
jgi:hypothetical protein